MRRSLFTIAVLICLAIESTTANSQENATKSPVFLVREPTIVAFFPPVTEAELKNDPDTNESLADFQYYAGQVTAPLLKRGIKFHVTYSASFSIHVGSQISLFRPGKVEVGYYLIAPGKKPRIEYGVLTDLDLLTIAKEYFGPVVEHR